MRSSLISLLAVLTILPAAVPAETLGRLANGRPELAAIAAAPEVPHCTGVMVGPDRVLTHRACLTDERGSYLPHLSILPGLNMSDQDGPETARPSPREFGARVHDLGGGVVILQTGQIKGRPLPGKIANVTDPRPPMSPGETLEVIHYAGPQGATQVFSKCGVGGETAAGRVLDCVLPEAALGAPVLRAGLPVGIVSRAGLDKGSRAVDLPAGDASEDEEEDLDASPFTALEVLNLCHQDVHVGLKWLDLDGQTWQQLARRIPADSLTLLPAATIGDSIFRYARSDDGTRIWSGSDLTVDMKGVTIGMEKLPVPRPTGDLRMTFACD